MNTEGRGCGSKTAAHSMVWAGVFINNPSGNGQTHGVFKNNSLKPNTASDSNTSWYTYTDGFLEYPPSGRPVQQGACVPENNSRFFCVLPHI